MRTPNTIFINIRATSRFKTRPAQAIGPTSTATSAADSAEVLFYRIALHALPRRTRTITLQTRDRSHWLDQDRLAATPFGRCRPIVRSTYAPEANVSFRPACRAFSEVAMPAAGFL